MPSLLKVLETEMNKTVDLTWVSRLHISPHSLEIRVLSLEEYYSKYRIKSPKNCHANRQSTKLNEPQATPHRSKYSIPTGIQSFQGNPCSKEPQAPLPLQQLTCSNGSSNSYFSNQNSAGNEIASSMRTLNDYVDGCIPSVMNSYMDMYLLAPGVVSNSDLIGAGGIANMEMISANGFNSTTNIGQHQMSSNNSMTINAERDFGIKCEAKSKFENEQAEILQNNNFFIGCLQRNDDGSELAKLSVQSSFDRYSMAGSDGPRSYPSTTQNGQTYDNLFFPNSGASLDRFRYNHASLDCSTSAMSLGILQHSAIPELLPLNSNCGLEESQNNIFSILNHSKTKERNNSNANLLKVLQNNMNGRTKSASFYQDVSSQQNPQLTFRLHEKQFDKRDALRNSRFSNGDIISSRL